MNNTINILLNYDKIMYFILLKKIIVFFSKKSSFYIC